MESRDVIIGESSVLECMKSGSPSPSLRWYKQNVKQGPSDTEFTLIEPTDRHFFTAEDQLLIIVKTTESDAGTYKCEMENSEGRASGIMKLTVRSTLAGGKNDHVNVDEMTCIVIITVVCCAVATSIIWVVIIYQTRKDSPCGLGGDGNGPAGNHINSDNPNFDKSNKLLTAAANSTIIIGDGTGIKPEPQHPIRTATISNGRGIIRSSSTSNNSHSSLGTFDEMFRKYPGVGVDDDASSGRNHLHPHRNGTESDEEENMHDDEALLGTAYFGVNGVCYHQPRKKSIDVASSISNATTPSKGKDSLIRRSRDCVDSATITTNTEDGDLDEKQPPSSISNAIIKMSTSLSTSSSCDSIPPLPYSASQELANGLLCNNSLSSGSVSSATPPLSTFMVDREHHQNLLNQQRAPLLNNHSPARQIYRDSSGSPVGIVMIQPKVHAPIVPRKPTIQTNKLNELVATLNK